MVAQLQTQTLAELLVPMSELVGVGTSNSDEAFGEGRLGTVLVGLEPTEEPSPGQHIAALFESIQARFVPMSGIVEELRGVLQGFIADHLAGRLEGATSKHTGAGHGIGLAARHSEPGTCLHVIVATSDAVEQLNMIEAALPNPSPLSLSQRGLIRQTVGALQNFLVDLAELTGDGQLDRSAEAAVVKLCIGFSQALSQISHGIEASMYQMQQPANGE
jgi:hypothetical protein